MNERNLVKEKEKKIDKNKTGAENKMLTPSRPQTGHCGPQPRSIT